MKIKKRMITLRERVYFTKKGVRLSIVWLLFCPILKERSLLQPAAFYTNCDFAPSVSFRIPR